LPVCIANAYDSTISRRKTNVVKVPLIVNSGSFWTLIESNYISDLDIGIARPKRWDSFFLSLRGIVKPRVQNFPQ
jgi:hypothetical protein